MIPTPNEAGAGGHRVDRSGAPTIGVLGFGKVGTALARLARSAGHRVIAAASGDPERIELIRDVLAPGIELGWAADVSATAGILILAVPLHARGRIAPHLVDGKIVVDATNHWQEADGPRDDWVPRDASTSEHLQELMPGARVVKAFNHVGYRDLESHGGRIAIAHASDDRSASAQVADLIATMGFTPVDVGALANGRVLEPGGAAFGAAVSEHELHRLIESSRVATVEMPAA